MSSFYFKEQWPKRKFGKKCIKFFRPPKWAILFLTWLNGVNILVHRQDLERHKLERHKLERHKLERHNLERHSLECDIITNAT